MARQCLNNMRTAANPVLASDEPFALLTAAQMFGSGKTYLGRHFLHQLRADNPSMQEIREKLKKEYGKELLEQLLNRYTYVLFDLRTIEVFTTLLFFL